MRIKDIIAYTFVLLLVISCTNKKIKKRYYCDMNNIYISVSEGDKYDSLIIGDTDSIIIRKTNGYYGEILLYFITGTDTIYIRTFTGYTHIPSLIKRYEEMGLLMCWILSP